MNHKVCLVLKFWVRAHWCLGIKWGVALLASRPDFPPPFAINVWNSLSHFSSPHLTELLFPLSLSLCLVLVFIKTKLHCTWGGVGIRFFVSLHCLYNLVWYKVCWAFWIWGRGVCFVGSVLSFFMTKWEQRTRSL